MARYYDARGHITCDFEQIEQIRGIIVTRGPEVMEWVRGEDSRDLYLSGWLYQPRPINWRGHVFYGASVQRDGVDLLEACLREIAARLTDVNGIFFVDDEEGEVREVFRLDGGIVSYSRE